MTTDVICLAQFFFGPKVTVKSAKEPPFLWDGETLYHSSESNLLHEISHLQLAPSWRRYKWGYGLGVEPEGPWGRRDSRLVSEVRSCFEEELASLLGIFWERSLHLPWWKTANYHTWLDDISESVESHQDFVRFLTSHKVVERAAFLLDLGLIDSDFKPLPNFASSWRRPRLKTGLSMV